MMEENSPELRLTCERTNCRLAGDLVASKPMVGPKSNSFPDRN